HDDGVRIWVNNQLVLDRWSTLAEPLTYGTSVSLTAGQAYTIKVDYYENGGGASLGLWAKAPGTTPPVADTPVPASWLSFAAPPLPQGWSMSGAPDDQLGYLAAYQNGQSVSLIDA